jgi:hypothetical protein
MTTSLTIARDNGYADVLRDYLVMLDDQEIGRLANGNSQTFSIPPGAHTLRVKIDWCGSSTVEFNALTDDHLHFRCGSSLRGLKLLLGFFYIILAPNRYLWLKSSNDIQR